jgi:hypothetical protein
VGLPLQKRFAGAENKKEAGGIRLLPDRYDTPEMAFGKVHLFEQMYRFCGADLRICPYKANEAVC